MNLNNCNHCGCSAARNRLLDVRVTFHKYGENHRVILCLDCAYTHIGSMEQVARLRKTDLSIDMKTAEEPVKQIIACGICGQCKWVETVMTMRHPTEGVMCYCCADCKGKENEK